MQLIPNNNALTGVLTHNKVHVWQACLDVTTSQIEYFTKILAPDERIRANKYLFTKDRQYFIAARGILRSLLAQYLNILPGKIIFNYGPTGKPKVAMPSTSLQFNLSHSGSTALYAMSWDMTLGIDIEISKKGFSLESMASIVFSTQEQLKLKTYPATQRMTVFLRGWTRKEAFIKAIGEGLSFPLKRIEVPFEKDIKDTQINVKHDTGSESHARLYCLESFSGHAAALVINGVPASVTLKLMHVP